MTNLRATLLLVAAVPPGPVAAQAAPPRLAVVLVIDQFRSDYLVRFAPHFGPGGFRRFLDSGVWFSEARHAHAVTKTCPGHAVVLTGAYAASTGIISNEWWSVSEGRERYCAEDDASPLLGTEGEGRSPRRLRVPTVGDELREFTSGRARVVAVAGKDRSAIMLGGRLADEVWWMVDTLFVTSSWYRSDLPEWARRFNASGAATAWFGKAWERLLPAEAYAKLGADDVPWERNKAGMGRAFPHRLGVGESRPGPGYVEAFETSPFQNELEVDFALTALRALQLGRDEVPDLLAIGLTANDRVGHAYGPTSHEVMDITIRTDRLLARLFDALDREVGLANVVVVLTADHGVAPAPEALEATFGRPMGRRLPADSVAGPVRRALEARYGPGAWVIHQNKPFVYLDEALLRARGVDVAEAEAVAAAAVAAVPGVAWAQSRSVLVKEWAAGRDTEANRSFHPGESGHVMYLTEPWVVEEDDPAGTGHGTPWAYDQRVPILWYGAGIQPGARHEEATVADIAPTLARLLGVPPPAAARGRVLAEALK